MRRDISPQSCFIEPIDGLCIILFNAITIIIAYAEIVLSRDVSLIGGFVEPNGGLCVILCNALPVFITYTEGILC